MMAVTNRLLILFLAVLLVLASANTVRAIQVVKSIRFAGPAVIAYDSYKGVVWVGTGLYSDVNIGPFSQPQPIIEPKSAVSAISDSNYTVVANVTLSQDPIGIAYDSALHEVYVGTGDTISVISDENNSVVATIDTNFFGDDLYNMVYDSGKGEMFVANSLYGGASEILVISGSTKQVVANISLGNNTTAYGLPYGLIYDSAKGEIYFSRITASGQNYEYGVSVISDSNNSIIATIPLENVTFLGSGAYDSATGEIYLPIQNNTVLIVSDKTHTVIDSIQLPNFTNSIGLNIAYDPVKSVLFADAGVTTYVISDRTRSVVDSIRWGGSRLMVYDSGRNVMVSIGGSIDFISDASLPSPPPTPTPTPTASPSPSGNQNPVFLGLDWVQLAILVLMGIVVVVIGVAAFMFLSKRRGTEQTKPA